MQRFYQGMDADVIQSDGAIPHCAPRLMTNPDLFEPGEYESRSEMAHQLLGGVRANTTSVYALEPPPHLTIPCVFWRPGFGLFSILLVWSGYILDFPSGLSLRRAYFAAGTVEIISGAFLFTVK